MYICESWYIYIYIYTNLYVYITVLLCKFMILLFCRFLTSIDSPSAPSYGWIPATFKSSTLSLPQSLHLDQLNCPEVMVPNVIQWIFAFRGLALQHSWASQQSQSSRPSVQDDDNTGDSPRSFGVSKKTAVSVKESSRLIKKRVGHRPPVTRVSSIPPLRKPSTIPRLSPFYYKWILNGSPLKTLKFTTCSARKYRLQIIEVCSI